MEQVQERLCGPACVRETFSLLKVCTTRKEGPFPQFLLLLSSVLCHHLLKTGSTDHVARPGQQQIQDPWDQTKSIHSPLLFVLRFNVSFVFLSRLEFVTSASQDCKSRGQGLIGPQARLPLHCCKNPGLSSPVSPTSSTLPCPTLPHLAPTLLYPSPTLPSPCSHLAPTLVSGPLDPLELASFFSGSAPGSIRNVIRPSPVGKRFQETAGGSSRRLQVLQVPDCESEVPRRGECAPRVMRKQPLPLSLFLTWKQNRRKEQKKCCLG